MITPEQAWRESVLGAPLAGEQARTRDVVERMLADGWLPIWPNGTRGGPAHGRRLPDRLEERYESGATSVISQVSVAFIAEAIPAWQRRCICRACGQLLPVQAKSA